MKDDTNESAIFDLRLHVTGATDTEVWERAYGACNALRELALDGVDVRYSQMRPARNSRTFTPTMEPRARDRRAWAVDAIAAEGATS